MNDVTLFLRLLDTDTTKVTRNQALWRLSLRKKRQAASESAGASGKLELQMWMKKRHLSGKLVNKQRTPYSMKTYTGIQPVQWSIAPHIGGSPCISILCGFRLKVLRKF